MAEIKCTIQKRISKAGNAVFFIKTSDTKEFVLDKFKDINESHINIENTFYYLDYKQKLIGVKVNEILFGETEIAIPVYKENVEEKNNNDMEQVFKATQFGEGKSGDYFIQRGKDRFYLDKFPNVKDYKIRTNYDIKYTITFINNKEKIKTLTVNGIDIPFENNFQPNNRNPQVHQQGGGGGNGNNTPATAPYNFIPLNDKIVPSEWKTQADLPTFDKWQDRLYNGYIDYQIENLTDMFIGNETNDSDKDIKNIFALDKEGNKPMVSGSSFRGLIKNIMAICAHSKLSQVEDKTLYWRNVVKENYNQYFLKATDYLAKAGYIQKDENGNYVIFEAKEDSWKNSYYKINTNTKPIFDNRTNRTKYQIKDKNNTIKNYQEFNSDSADENLILEYEEVWFMQANKTNHNHRGRQLKYALINNTDFSFLHFPNSVKGKLVITGNFTHKKHFHWIVNEMDSNKSFIIDNEIVNEYKNDINLDDRANLIKRLEDNDNKPIPCFYVEIKGKLRFGHTPLFRIPYEKSISDHIPTTHKETIQLDITEALFGMIRNGNSASIFTSRLNFIDAKLIEYKGKNTLIGPKIHGTPKPTAYRMYLKQNNGNPQNWNSENAVRGFKLYHHNIVNVVEETGKWKEKSHPKKMASLKQNCKFKGRIYFDNLSKIELGALLFVLQLKEGLALKIGASKAYGMGSIKISDIKLYTINRKERYSSLFTTTNDKQEFNLATKEVTNFTSIISTFEKHILDIIDKTKKSLWETDRLKELEKILTFSNIDKQNWNEKTSYMKVDDKKWKNNLQLITELTSNI